MAEPMQFREVWLHNAVEKVSALLSEHVEKVPPVRVSAGWPSKGGTSTKKRVIGQCWKAEASEDGVAQVFISPMLDDGPAVLAVLVHELIHAIHPEAKHQGAFIGTAKDVGLVAPWTATSAGPDLTGMLVEIDKELGPYPHSKITPIVQEKVQTTRMLKLECLTCGYIARTTQKWVDVGLPSCPDGDEMEIAEVKAK